MYFGNHAAARDVLLVGAWYAAGLAMLLGGVWPPVWPAVALGALWVVAPGVLDVAILAPRRARLAQERGLWP